MSLHVAVLIPLRLLRKLRSISTAKPNLLPNPYSHNTWIKKGGIPRSLGQISSDQVGEVYREHLRGDIRQMIVDAMADEVSELCVTVR